MTFGRLQVVSLASGRNMATLGTAIMLGLMIPLYVNDNENAFSTGTHTLKRYENATVELMASFHEQKTYEGNKHLTA